MLIVPYPRRRRVEATLRGARIEAQWIDVPTPADIRARDRERLLTTLLAPVETEEEDRALGARLLVERTPEEIAAALVRAHRAALPAAEELIEATPDARRAASAEGHRPGFDDAVWFRMDIGRRQNADPRWLLPLLCRRGHITRNEVGAIRIGPGETRFQIPLAIAGRFDAAVARTGKAGNDDGSNVRIERVVDGVNPSPPRAAGKQQRAQPHRR